MSNENDDFIRVDIKKLIDETKKETRDIIESRYNELVHRMEYRAEVTQTALKEAKSELSLRLAGMNEFRDTIKDLIASFATRAELDAIKDQTKNHITRAEHDALSDRVSRIDLKLGDLATKDDIKSFNKRLNEQGKWQIGLLVGFILILIGVIIDMAGFKI